MKKRIFAFIAAALMAILPLFAVFADESGDVSSLEGLDYGTFDRTKYADEEKYWLSYYDSTQSTMVNHGLIPSEERKAVDVAVPGYNRKTFNICYRTVDPDRAVIEQYGNVYFPYSNAAYTSLVIDAPEGIDEWETRSADGNAKGGKRGGYYPLHIAYSQSISLNIYPNDVYNHINTSISRNLDGAGLGIIKKSKTPVEETVAKFTGGREAGKEILTYNGMELPDSYIELTVEKLDEERTLYILHTVKHEGYDYVHGDDGKVTGYKVPEKRYEDNLHEDWEFMTVFAPKGFPELYLLTSFSLYTSAEYDNGKSGGFKEYASDRVFELLELHESQKKDVYNAIRSLMCEKFIVTATDPYTKDGIADTIDVVVDTSAAEEAGEDEGTPIPAVIVLGTLGTAAALAAAAGTDGDGGEDEKKSSSYKMYINKNFGNQLKKGDKPQPVYARIVEITPNGNEIPRENLTSKIRVFSSDNSLRVTDGGMADGYRCAMVSVYDVEEQEPEGKVSFFFEGEGGTFTQNVIFNIVIPGIKFFQNNLTLPAGMLDEPEFLPFEVTDMGEKYEIELSFNGDDYEIDLAECSDPEAPDIHYAVFMEKSKEKYEPGVYTEGWLNVKVTNETQEIKASLKVFRMGMGLCVPINALNCYRVPKKESAGKEMKKMTPADFDTSVTETPAFVLYFDKENHQVCQQAAFPEFSFTAPEGETDEKKKQISEALAALKITPKLTKYETDFAYYSLVCEGGCLDAPTRYVVRMKCSVDTTIGEIKDGMKVGTEHFECVRDVLLRSQPSRVVAGVHENYEVYKYDEQISEMLYDIKKIVFENFLNQMFPLYNMIDRMVSGYDRAYGYDPYQVAKVVDVWERFQSGELKGIGSEVNRYGVADELEALAAATRSWDGWQGVVLRLSLDIMTGGASEVAMVALDVNRAVMDYRKETGGNGTAYGYFKAAAIPLVFAVGFGAAAAIGKGASKLAGKASRKLMPKQTPALIKKAQAIKNTAKEMAELAAKDVGNVVGAISAKIPQGAKNISSKIGEYVNTIVEKVDKFDPKLSIPKSANATKVVKAGVDKGKTGGDALIDKAKASPKTMKEKCIDMAGNASNKEGEVLYNEMIAAKKALQANPADKALQQRYNQTMMNFKSSHSAIEHANGILPGEELAMRKVLNEDLEKTLTSKVEQKFKTKIADKYNIDPNTVKIDRVSGNDGLAKKFGRDCDMTPKVVTEKGGTKYVSQATTDELLEQSIRETVEETCGKEFAQKFAKKGKFSRKLDFTGCTPQHKDYFTGGADTAMQVIKKDRMGEYMGAEKARSVADTLRYKGAHPYAEGARLEKEVLSGLSDSEVQKLYKELETFAKADAATAKTIQLSENAMKLKEAYALMEEGVYQPAKYGKKIFDKEWVAIKNGYSETLTAVDYANARILDRGCGQALPNEMMTKGESWVGERITLSETRKACELNGSSLEKAINGVGDAFEMIDAKFGYRIKTTEAMKKLGDIASGVGIGGGINAVKNGIDGNE